MMGKRRRGAAGFAVTILVGLCGCHAPGEGATSEQGGFEGTVQMLIPRSTSGGVTFWIKGDKVRWNLDANDESAGYRIYDAHARRMFTVEPQVPSVLVSDVLAAREEEGGTAWSLVSVRPDSLAGYPCDRVQATNGTVTYDVCAARGMPVLPLEYALPNMAAAMPFLPALEARGQTPLAVVRQDPDGGSGVSTPELLTIQLRRVAIEGARVEVPKYPQTAVRLFPPRAIRR
jgi:hypothetical protein